MSIPPALPWRGCAAHFRQPVSEDDELGAQFLVETVYYFNCRPNSSTPAPPLDSSTPAPPLADIEYRTSNREHDILHRVFRWDLSHYQDAFHNGFEARRQEGTPDEVFYSLDHHVHHGGRPLDTRPRATRAFVSTTLNQDWHPIVDPGTTEDYYRYELYAPGGIWVAETLGDRYRYPRQDEVCFVAGIAPQYIRSAQLFRLTCEAGTRRTRWARANTVLILNRNFDPQLDPLRLFDINQPVLDYEQENGERVPLDVEIYPPGQRKKRQAYSTDSDTTNWYARDVGDCESYINAAFRSSRENEAYLFMKNEYVLVNYAPWTKGDEVMNGPLLICDGYPSLTGTAFAEHGIDCAFGSHDKNEAFIFSGNLCAQINYAPGTKDDYIIKGPMTITAMFPFFKRTVFENGVDAAFESTTKYEAYLFKEDKYALINYGAGSSKLFHIKIISENFPSLKDTIFKSDIEAAFASHKTDEAYLFKGDSYTLINFAPRSTDDYIDGVKMILPNWPSLRSILPRKNRGLDLHHHKNTERDHDEL